MNLDDPKLLQLLDENNLVLNKIINFDFEIKNFNGTVILSYNVKHKSVIFYTSFSSYDIDFFEVLQTIGVDIELLLIYFEEDFKFFEPSVCKNLKHLSLILSISYDYNEHPKPLKIHNLKNIFELSHLKNIELDLRQIIGNEIVPTLELYSQITGCKFEYNTTT